ncbi:MAG: S41 family peptidase [Gammaproteobacteria bacterium]
MKQYRLISCLISCLSACVYSSLILAAEPNVYGADQLEYYLYQGFHSPADGQRHRLNHIGIAGEQTADGFLVTAVLQGYPAHAAGLNRGDIITTVNGIPFHPVFAFNDKDRAPADLEPNSLRFEMDISRNNQNLELSVTPVFENLYDSYRSATVQSVQEFSSGNKTIGYLQAWFLSRSTADLISLQQLLEGLAHCDGLIVDLRGSYGFLDTQHLRMFGATVEAPVSGQESYPVPIDPYRKPIALLIDSSTRGAAEKLAAELDEAERIITLGEVTAGLLGGFAAVNESSLEYLPSTGEGRSGQLTEGSGLVPEQSVPYPASESRRDDPQFETAVTLLLGVI